MNFSHVLTGLYSVALFYFYEKGTISEQESFAFFGVYLLGIIVGYIDLKLRGEVVDK